MNQPKFLHKGATVGILSTARKIPIPEIEAAIELLHSWDLKVVLGTTIDLEENQFAGNDMTRALNFQQFMDDEHIDAIWCARGGYGTIRMVDQLDFSRFIKKPKWIIGYSDITVLHSKGQQLNFETLHATMPINVLKNTPEAIESLRKVLFGGSLNYTIPSVDFNRKGEAKGELIGGNLSMLYSMTGSDLGLDTKGKILFLEDLDEYLYHIDRMLMNLKRNGYFNDLAGLIVGGMTDMNDNSVPFGKNAHEIILDITKEYDFPICFNFPAGHLDDNRALIFGKEVVFSVDSEVKLTF
ncbi:putative murein peptide carboxypeptidase [Kordia antarctica]|uniref:Putative murein peptide carboxypeptidase n=1 Tax=Kordia antarctica TaxID=1218801 RepID=A0A7L4ZMY0_9FLAO|nr:LD-carboxypeptidase [Kordia antarctica]QHI37861.1 putative murein peptide carboxypeptidase [Kordia antarctica]